MGVNRTIVSAYIVYPPRFGAKWWKCANVGAWKISGTSGTNIRHTRLRETEWIEMGRHKGIQRWMPFAMSL